MKIIITIFLIVINLTLYSQRDVKLFSEIMVKSVISCIESFNSDTIDYDIPLNNIIIRPISVNKTYDTAIFSLEMNCVPVVLKQLQIAGLLKLGNGKTLFLQRSHLPVDFTGINWVKDSNTINTYIDSLYKFVKLKPWEPHPLTALCVLSIRTSRNNILIAALDVDYYLKRDVMDKKYFPVTSYPKNIILDTCAGFHS